MFVRKLAIVKILLAFSSGTFAAVPQFSDVDREANGNARFVNLETATNYCQDRGWKLPSVRDFALLAAGHGARISETQFPGVSEDSLEVSAERHRMIQAGLFPIESKNAAGETVVEIYYNNDGYKRVEGEEAGPYWTSSPFLFIYNNGNFHLGKNNKQNVFKVRCVIF